MAKYKYGLRCNEPEINKWLYLSNVYPSYTLEEIDAYINMVHFAHCFVESWLDVHPEYPFRSDEQHGYYAVLKLASPEYDEKILQWSLDHKARREAYKAIKGNEV